MDHPKDQPLCLVSWTCREYLKYTPPKSNIDTKHDVLFFQKVFPFKHGVIFGIYVRFQRGIQIFLNRSSRLVAGGCITLLLDSLDRQEKLCRKSRRSKRSGIFREKSGWINPFDIQVIRPPEINKSHLKRDHCQKENSPPNQHFSGEALVFRRVIPEIQVFYS